MKKLMPRLLLICIILCACTQAPNEPTSTTPSINTPTEAEKAEITPTLVLTIESTDHTDELISDTFTNTTSDNSPFIHEGETGTDYLISKLPFSSNYNERTFTIKDVNYYRYTDLEDKNALFVAITVDVSEIPDKEVDWFIDDTSSIFTTVYLTNDDNDYDFDSMERIKIYHFTDTKELCYIYMTNPKKKYRYPFDECSLSIFFSITQKEKYEKDGEKRHKKDTVMYDVDITKDDIEVLGIMDLDGYIRTAVSDYTK